MLKIQAVNWMWICSWYVWVHIDLHFFSGQIQSLFETLLRSPGVTCVNTGSFSQGEAAGHVSFHMCSLVWVEQKLWRLFSASVSIRLIVNSSVCVGSFRSTLLLINKYVHRQSPSINTHYLALFLMLKICSLRQERSVWLTWKSTNHS